MNSFRTSALGLALLFLSAAAMPQQQSPKPTSPTQAQLQEQINELKKHLDAVDNAATKAAMEKDYIIRIQSEYESYYERVLGTQTHTLWIMGGIITVILAVAGLFSLRVFDERTRSAVAEATRHLRTQFDHVLDTKMEELQKSNTADIEKLKAALTEKMSEFDKDMNLRAAYSFELNQGQAAGADHRYEDARLRFRACLGIYKQGKSRGLFRKAETAGMIVGNILVSLERQGGPQAQFEANARKELADPLYDDLADELAATALVWPDFAQILRERI